MSTPTLDLLLSDFETGKPTVSGLDERAAHQDPRARGGKLQSFNLRATEEDSSDLELQKWAVVYPDTPKGRAAREEIQPLIELRANQQRASCKSWALPPNMDEAATQKWDRQVYENAEEEEIPYYLLVLGDLDEVPAAFQKYMGSKAAVGRLAFPDAERYGAYAQKVVRYATRTDITHDKPRALFYTVQDGTRAVDQGFSNLARPLFEVAEKRRAKNRFAAREVIEFGDLDDPEPDELLSAVREHTGDLLFTLSHGLGAPARVGWRTPNEQRRFQGAMQFPREIRLEGRDVAEGAFLPGGIWFFMACFGAGTPADSVYKHWLAKLRSMDEFGGRIAAITESLPEAGQPGFVAALPQAALANPDGPLAVIGHLDLAWTYSYVDLGDGNQPHSRRFRRIFEHLAQGKRAATGIHPLVQAFDTANLNLTTMYDRQAQAIERGDLDPTDAKLLGHRWMKRNDLFGYVLLGDPAARIPLASNRAASFDPSGERPIEVRSAPPPAEAPSSPATTLSGSDAPPAEPPGDASAPSDADLIALAPDNSVLGALVESLQARIATAKRVSLTETTDPETGQITRALEIED